ncbi:MAG: Hpt domain-containing protein [Myxococcota bacterium]|nr:Hpt domain-containing protein [Myxococcota bacterium]
MKLTQKQLEELVAVFRSESIEHIKAMAEVFLGLEGGSVENVYDALDIAFREAHSLKGAAGTLGFGRVETLTHCLEDVLGTIRQTKRPVTADLVDRLLSSLDVIRIASNEALPGEDDLNEKEQAELKLLKTLIENETVASDVQSEQAPQPEPQAASDDDVQPKRSSTAGRDVLATELGSSQMDQLTGVFRSEALEHIKTLSEVLFTLEEGKTDSGELLTRAFREAHSMKGSAGTLGFARVEAVTHRLEDVFGQLSRGARQVTPKDVDLLLTALDVIRTSIENSVSGDDQLTKEESETAQALNALAKDLAKASGKDDKASVERVDLTPEKQDPAPPKTEPQSTTNKAPASKKSTPSQDPSARAAQKPKDEFIRIAESKIDSVIALVSELFEANMQLESLVHELNGFCNVANELSSAFGTLMREFEGTEYETELHGTIEKARNLNIQLRMTTTRFERDERQISKLIQSSQEELRKIRMAPVSSLFVMIRRQVREASKVTGKKLELFLGGGEYAVDRKVLDAIEEPLVHILRNAASHGIESADQRKEAQKSETARISVVARHTGDAVEITVADDGRGIDPESIRKSLREKRGLTADQVEKFTTDQLLDYLFESGFSTQKGVTKISGRGVGLDVVKYTVERLGGEVRLESEVGVGTAITLRLPLAMSTIRCLLLRVAGRVLAIPASNVEKVIIPSSEDLKLIGSSEVILYGGQNVPLGSLGSLLGLASDTSTAVDANRMVAIISFGERRYAFRIDELIEYTQLILKPLGDLLGRVPNISGISLLGTGDVAIVLNPADLVRAAGGVRKESDKQLLPELSETVETTRVLVVDDSIATRTLEKTLLESAGFMVLTASDGYKALDTLSTNRFDIVLSDIQMPNMDGFELARTIKSRAQFSHLPVILISSLGSDEDKARGLAAGADAYIVKRELTQQELVETINQLL